MFMNICTAEENIPFIGIIGPTAVGKTAWSLRMAEALHGEIVSVDSRQVYRYLDVGADKIDAATRERIPHHLLDVVNPDEPFSAADFGKLASRAIRDIRSRGKTPLLVGGTPFYFRVLTDPLLSEDLPKSWELRERLEERAQREGAELLHEELRRGDPEYAAKIHPRDLHRIIRGLELWQLCGTIPSELFRERGKSRRSFRPLYIGFWKEREDLCATIARRVKQQFSSGFVEEVAQLLEMGYDSRLPALQGFGYRELVCYHEGECSLQEALEGDIRATRAFSRRQMTWFRKFSPTLWYHVSRLENHKVFSELMSRCAFFLEGGSP